MLPCQAACDDFWGLGASLCLQACLGWEGVFRAFSLMYRMSCLCNCSSHRKDNLQV